MCILNEQYEECHGCEFLEPIFDISEDTVEIKVNSLLIKELEKANSTIKSLKETIEASSDSYRRLSEKYQRERSYNESLRMRINALQGELSKRIYSDYPVYKDVDYEEYK